MDTNSPICHKSQAPGSFLGISLSHIAAIMVCHWIGQLTPSAFVSTYHTIAAQLFPTEATIKRTKMNCPSLGALWIKNIKTLKPPLTHKWMFLSQLQLLVTPMTSVDKLIAIVTLNITKQCLFANFLFLIITSTLSAPLPNVSVNIPDILSCSVNKSGDETQPLRPIRIYFSWSLKKHVNYLDNVFFKKCELLHSNVKWQRWKLVLHHMRSLVFCPSLDQVFYKSLRYRFLQAWTGNLYYQENAWWASPPEAEFCSQLTSGSSTHHLCSIPSKAVSQCEKLARTGKKILPGGTRSVRYSVYL